MLPGSRVISGVSCEQVLALLSDYLDQSLPHQDREAVREHVHRCNVCRLFGDKFSALIDQLNSQRRDAEDLPADTALRLRERLGL